MSAHFEKGNSRIPHSLLHIFSTVTPSVCRRRLLLSLCVHFTLSRTTPSFFIQSCSNFVGMCRMTLPKNVNFQKRDLGSKNFFKNYFSEKMTVFCKLLIYFASDHAQILQAFAEWPCPKTYIFKNWFWGPKIFLTIFFL